MNVQLLIDSIVRQTTVLIAQLATSFGVRAPLAHVASQVFYDLAKELENQGLSRKVTADMFGISLRSYQRRIQRLKESSTDRGQSLWEAIIDYLRKESVVTRAQVFQRFHRDEEGLIRSILRDLVDNGLAFRTGSDREVVYRLANQEELIKVGQLHANKDPDELVWALVFHEGPVDQKRLASLAQLSSEQIETVLHRLLTNGRIHIEQRGDEPYYRSKSLVVPRDAETGREASIYDHFHAVVQTICCKLHRDPEIDKYNDLVGGSTYTFDVGPNHPLEAEVLHTLDQFRDRCSELRQRVLAHNQAQGPGEPHESVIVYAGQCVIPQDASSDEQEEKGK